MVTYIPQHTENWISKGFQELKMLVMSSNEQLMKNEDTYQYTVGINFANFSKHCRKSTTVCD